MAERLALIDPKRSWRELMSEMEHIECTPSVLAFPVGEGLVRACRDTFGPTLRAVVLTGSLARNEASYTLREGRAVLQSDVEAMVVLQDGAALPSRHSSEALCQLAQSYLADRGVSVEVSFSVVHSTYLLELPPHIYSYELRACGVVLYGEPRILGLIPDYAAADLSREDAWRLLSNRLIEQMVASQGKEAATATRYRSVKLCLDLASSLLVFFGRFEAGYRPRLHCMEELALTAEAQQLPIAMDEFMPLVRLCTSVKLSPEVEVDLGEGFPSRMTRWAWQVWLWQLHRMTGCGDTVDAEQMVRNFGRSQGKKKLLRGWLYAVRRTGWLGSACYWPKWLLLFIAGLTPRHAIYLAAYRWHEVCGGQALVDLPRSFESVCDLLPVKGTVQAASGSAMSARLVWNYKEFTVETRA
jgi:hypothetical protein